MDDKDIMMDCYSWQPIKPKKNSKPSKKSSIIVSKFVVMTATNPEGTGRKITSHGFKKYFYRDTLTSNCLIVYKGSLDGVVRGIHGNSKYSDKLHIQTSKSVGKAIRDRIEHLKTDEQTFTELRRNILPFGFLADRFQPRNIAQVAYQRKVAKKSCKLARDEHQSLFLRKDTSSSYGI